jgi:integrase
VAERLELREGNPVARVDPPKSSGRDPVILSLDEYNRLLDACGSHDMLRLWVLVLGETGCRAYSEGSWLRWEDVDLAEGFLWIDSSRHGRRTKSGKGRWVPMTSRLRDAMRAHFARYRFATYGGKPSPWLFHHVPGLKGRGKHGERIKELRTSFETARAAAELPEGFVAHDLRHRRATTWIAQGGDVVKVKEALGHADLRTTMAYTHLAREHLKDLVEPSPASVPDRVGTAS